MKDSISKNQGNSRYLKSNLLEGTSWDAALALLRAGTFPIDLNGINADGWTQVGTALNKANLLTDATASALDLTGDDPTVNDALEELATNYGRCEVVSHVGTGSSGSADSPISLTFTFAPKVVIACNQWLSSSGYQGDSGLATMWIDKLTTSFESNRMWGLTGNYGKKSEDGKTISWYGGTTYNYSSREYYFIGLA